MEQSPKKPDDLIKSTLLLSQHYRVSAMVISASVFSIALLAYLGYRLDLYFATYPFLLIVGVLVSFPLSQVLIIKWIKEKYIPSRKTLS